MSDLSRRSGVSIATIKFYLREGLLRPGVPTGRNQAIYTEAHLERLALIRTLVTVGGLSLATVHEVLDAVDAQCAAAEHDARQPLAEQAHGLLRGLGWRVGGDAPALTSLGQVIGALRQLGWRDDVTALQPIAEAADLTARCQRRLALDLAPPSATASTVLLETVLSVLCALARENADATAAEPAEAGTSGDHPERSGTIPTFSPARR